MRYLKLLFIFFILSLFFTAKVHAQEFQKDYAVDYYLQEKSGVIETKAQFNLKLTNLSGEIIIKAFTLSFPKTFTIHDIVASNNGVPIIPQVTQGEQDITVQVEFPNAEVGAGTVNNLKIEFLQDNLFKVNGNVWEVILPTIKSDERNSYQVRVHLPDNQSKKISIAKPIPDSVESDVITWNNPQTKTIYAVFGDSQLYKAKLTYHLSNPKLTPVYTDIALPPETAYQKIFINNLNPAPSLVYLDDDGNFLARYILKPKENYDVVYDGVIELTVKPQDEVRNYVKTQFARQKSVLLQTPGFWQNQNTNRYASVQDVYRYITSTFSYNYKRVSANVERLGAQTALINPKNAVCTEFTDGFIALARDSGLYAREIQGYGFSNDQQLRPLSLQSDILHAWPEYYDLQQNLWIPVDPTWENTSGIDYFNSFDLNHIAFVIHGKRPDYPYPAGTYKQKESQDIAISATDKTPAPVLTYIFSGLDGPRRLHPGTSYGATLSIKNTGNTFAWNVPVTLTGKNVSVSPSSSVLDVIAPYQEKKITISYSPKITIVGQGSIGVIVAGHPLATVTLNITPLFIDILTVVVPIVVLSGLFMYFILEKKRRRNAL